MNDTVRTLVKEKIQEGMQADMIRSILISEGHNTDGFYEEYLKIQKETDVTPAAPTKGPHLPGSFAAFTQNEASKAESLNAHKLKKRTMNIVRVCVGLFVIIVFSILILAPEKVGLQGFFAKTTADLQEGVNPADIKLKAQLNSMQLSAQTYKARLTDYQGLCESIGIDRTVYVCSENTDAFIIQVKLSNDMFYCVDDTGFSGMISAPVRNSFSCQ